MVLHVVAYFPVISHGLLLRAPPHAWEDVVNTFAVLRAWQDHLEAHGRLSAKTRGVYRRTLITFLSDILVGLDEVTPEMLQAYLKSMADRPAQRDMTLKALYSFYRWGSRKYPELDDPTEDFYIRKRRKRAKVDTLSTEQLEALFAGAEEVDPRARPTLELMYGTAGRVHSITELRPEDLDLERRLVHFELGVKNDSPYTLPLGPRAYAAALQLLDLIEYHTKWAPRREDKLVGVGDQSVRNWMSAAAQHGGLDRKVYPHLLRRTALSALANDPEVSIAVVVATANWEGPDPYRSYVTTKPGPLAHALSKL